MAPALVDLKEVSTFTPGGHILSDRISFALKKHEIILIEGDNGSGKTTLAKAILGLHKNFKGHIRLRTSKVDYLPQMGNVQFFLPVSLHDAISLKSPSSLNEILDLGLMSESSLKRPWNSASGGERQKALLTRALLSRSEFLVLDEPLNHLDAQTRGRASALIENLAKQGCAILLISHIGSDHPLKLSQKLTLNLTEGLK